jgi:hypothetical protein
MSRRYGRAPPSSPDLNPIEPAFAKLKGLLRKAGKQTVEELWTFLGEALDAFTPQECRRYLSHYGYSATPSSKTLSRLVRVPAAWCRRVRSSRFAFTYLFAPRGRNEHGIRSCSRRLVRDGIGARGYNGPEGIRIPKSNRARDPPLVTRTAMADDAFIDLMARVRRGDARAAQELFRQFEPQVRREVRLRLRDPRLRRLLDDADVCQSVLLPDGLISTRGVVMRLTRRDGRLCGKSAPRKRPVCALSSRAGRGGRAHARHPGEADARRVQLQRAADRVSRELGLEDDDE